MPAATAVPAVTTVISVISAIATTACTQLILLLALARSCAGEEPMMLPACLSEASPQFLRLTEYVVMDAIDEVPESVRGRLMIPLADYLRALGSQRAGVDLGRESMDGVLIHAQHHWLLVTAYHTYVKRALIGVIDDRPGALHALPATPAVPGGAHALAQPESAGVTVSVGSGRIFCGVRSQARSLLITHDDLQTLATLLRAPSAASLMAVLGGVSP
jgi:hypothetical protein